MTNEGYASGISNKNIDDINFEVPQRVVAPENHNTQQSGRTKIFISNLNINLSNVFINMKDVSIPSSPRERKTQKSSDSFRNLAEELVRNNLNSGNSKAT